MTEYIFVVYRPIGRGFHHKYIMYTTVDDSGQPRKHFAAGGPDGYFDGQNDAGGVYGRIDTYYGVYDEFLDNGMRNPDYAPYPDHIDHRYERIISGDDLSKYWALITNAMDKIKEEEIPYSPIDDNSNSVVDTALAESGLPLPTWDELGSPNLPTFVSPGSDRMLLPNDNPPPPEPPPSGYYSPSWFFPPEGPLGGSEAAISPLVLDLDGDGIELTELGATATWFDLDADDFLYRLAGRGGVGRGSAPQIARPVMDVWPEFQP